MLRKLISIFNNNFKRYSYINKKILEEYENL